MDNTLKTLLKHIPKAYPKALGTIQVSPGGLTFRANASGTVNLMDAVSYATDDILSDIKEGQQQSLIGVAPLNIKTISDVAGKLDEVGLPGYVFNITTSTPVKGASLGFPKNLAQSLYVTLNNTSGAAVNVPLTLTYGNFDDSVSADFPAGFMATDGNNFYITDSTNNQVLKTDMSGNLVDTWKTFGDGNRDSFLPVAVCVSGGYVYVVDQIHYRVIQFDTSGNYIAQWGTAGAGTTNLQSPHDIKTDGTYLYVLDPGNSRVIQLAMPLPDPSTPYIASWGSVGTGNTNLYNPMGMTWVNNNLYINDSLNGRVVQLPTPLPSPSTPCTATWGSPGTGTTNLSFPFGITNDNAYLYVCDLSNHRVVKIPYPLPSPATPYTSAFNIGAGVYALGCLGISNSSGYYDILVTTSPLGILDLNSTNGAQLANYNFKITTPKQLTIPNSGSITLQYTPNAVDPTGVPGTYALVYSSSLGLEPNYSITADVGADDTSFTYPGRPNCIESIGVGFGVPRIYHEELPAYKNRIKLQAFGTKNTLAGITLFLKRLYPTDSSLKIFEGFTMPGVNTGFSTAGRNTSLQDLKTYISGKTTVIKQLDSNTGLLTDTTLPYSDTPFLMYIVFTSIDTENRGVFSGGSSGYKGYSGYSGYSGTFGSMYSLFKSTGSNALTSTFHSARPQGNVGTGYATYGGFLDANQYATTYQMQRLALIVQEVKAAGITAVFVQIIQ